MRSRMWVAAQVLFALVLFVFAIDTLRSGWAGAAEQLSAVRARWSLIAMASAIVLATYALLIETWRIVLRAWGAALEFGAAGYIWFVSNLGRYVPGKVWQIVAMSAMAKQRNISAVAATGASLLVNLASVATGILVVLATGAGVLGRIVDPDQASTASGPIVGVLLLVITLGGLLAFPYALPLLARALKRVTGRDVLEVPVIPARAVWLACAGTAFAWILYGVAFASFSRALFDSTAALTAGGLFSYVAVYTGSYLVGYLALFVPGGIGVRESVLIVAMPALGLATPAETLVIAVASRMWLLALEVAPGLLLLALRPFSRFSDPHDESPT